jgi:hypothetical protein
MNGQGKRSNIKRPQSVSKHVLPPPVEPTPDRGRKVDFLQSPDPVEIWMSGSRFDSIAIKRIGWVRSTPSRPCINEKPTPSRVEGTAVGELDRLNR